MLDERSLHRIDSIKQRLDLTDIHHALKFQGSVNCVFCGRKNKACIYNGQYYKCYSSKCGASGDLIKIYRMLNDLEGKGSFYQALSELEQLAGITDDFQNIVNERVKIYEEALNIYKYILLETKEGEPARDYLKSRGFEELTLEMYDIGYSPNKNILKSYNLDYNLLKKHNLLQDDKDYFINRIIFPIRDKSKRVVHFVGRFLGNVPKNEEGEDALLRYKNSKASLGFSSTLSYLIFEDCIEEYLNQDDFVVLCEGYPDTLSLKQLAIPTIGILGLEGLVKQFDKLSSFRKIYIIADIDYFELDHPQYPGELKSWIRLIPQIYELQCILPNTEFYVVFIPEDKGFKDVNDWISKSKIGKSDVLSYININKQDFVPFYINRKGVDLSYHQNILRMINMTNKGKEDLNKYITPELSPLEYGLLINKF